MAGLGVRELDLLGPLTDGLDTIEIVRGGSTAQSHAESGAPANIADDRPEPGQHPRRGVIASDLLVRISLSAAAPERPDHALLRPQASQQHRSTPVHPGDFAAWGALRRAAGPDLQASPCGETQTGRRRYAPTGA